MAQWKSRDLLVLQPCRVWLIKILNIDQTLIQFATGLALVLCYAASHRSSYILCLLLKVNIDDGDEVEWRNL